MSRSGLRLFFSIKHGFGAMIVEEGNKRAGAQCQQDGSHTGLPAKQETGVGTILLALGTGPLISFFNDHCAKPMLYGKEQAQA